MPTVERKPRKHWTKEAIILELQATHSEGTPISSPELGKKDKNLLKLSKRYFGSFGEAAEAAGLPFVERTGRRWSRELVVAELRALQAQGVPMTFAGVKGADSALSWATIEKFGTFNNALDAAGLPFRPSGEPTVWTDERIVSEIKGARRRGEDLSYSGARRTHSALVSAACNHFGSWRAAVEAAGLVYESRMRIRPEFTGDGIVQGLRQMHAEGKDLGYSAVYKSDLSMLQAAKRVFGSYDEALRAAGFDPSEYKRIPVGRPRKAKQDKKAPSVKRGLH